MSQIDSRSSPCWSSGHTDALFEQVSGELTLSPRCFFRSSLLIRALALCYVGQNLTEPLIFDDGSLLNLLQLIESSIGQAHSAIFYLKGAIWVIDDRNALPGEGTRHRGGLEHEEDLVVL